MKNQQLHKFFLKELRLNLVTISDFLIQLINFDFNVVYNIFNCPDSLRCKLELSFL